MYYYKRRELGEKLRKARQGKGLTVRAAAQALGINYAYLSKIETGVNPLGKHSAAVADFYGLDRVELDALANEKLPGFGTYLRTAYDLPPEAVTELEAHFAEVVKGGRS